MYGCLCTEPYHSTSGWKTAWKRPYNKLGVEKQQANNKSKPQEHCNNISIRWYLQHFCKYWLTKYEAEKQAWFIFGPTIYSKGSTPLESFSLAPGSSLEMSTSLCVNCSLPLQYPSHHLNSSEAFSSALKQPFLPVVGELMRQDQLQMMTCGLIKIIILSYGTILFAFPSLFFFCLH